jgi:hypothetical protein
VWQRASAIHNARMVGKPDHERTFALPLQIEHRMLNL